jgi:TolB-like protein
VLPFVDMSQPRTKGYFSDGISEELLNLLAKIPQLKVAARTSSFSFKGKEVEIPEIARQLHVAHVLEGSVRKSGDQLRITAQLIAPPRATTCGRKPTTARWMTSSRSRTRSRARW